MDEQEKKTAPEGLELGLREPEEQPREFNSPWATGELARLTQGQHS